MTTGVSVGWFKPEAIAPVPETLVKRILSVVPMRPLSAVLLDSPTDGIAVSYMVLNGGGPVAVLPKPHPSLPDGRAFFFVMKATRRPLLLVSPVGHAETSRTLTGRSELSSEEPGRCRFGALELRDGLAVHFDVEQQWVGFAQAPQLGSGLWGPCGAVIIRVDGVAADRIDVAMDAAIRATTADRQRALLSGR